MTKPTHNSIFDAASRVLAINGARDKAHAGHEVADAWQAGALDLSVSRNEPPERPGRPAEPALCAPGDVPKRRLGSTEGRLALIHAITHIELNAIDLAFDMIARFAPGLPHAMQRDFVTDWLAVGDDECRHFLMLADWLEQNGSCYGALPAHDGLWDAARKTGDDVLARLAIAPLVLEARGLDVTPKMIDSLRKAGDAESAQLLSIIYEDEISHVATGARWLKQLCEYRGLDPRERFQDYVRERFPGGLKQPFNHEAREKAGFEQNFYLTLTE